MVFAPAWLPSPRRYSPEQIQNDDDAESQDDEYESESIECSYCGEEFPEPKDTISVKFVWDMDPGCWMAVLSVSRPEGPLLKNTV